MNSSETPDLQIADLALIGDRRSAALASRYGAIEWCCMPRLDRGSCFGRLLDPAAGHLSIRPAGRFDPAAASREYVAGTMVLATTLAGAGGEIRLTDGFAPLDDARASPSRLIRIAEAVGGAAEVEVELRIRFDYGAVSPWLRDHGEGLHSATGGNDALLIWSDRELELDGRHDLRARIRLAEGERLRLALSSELPEEIDRAAPLAPTAAVVDEWAERAVAGWRAWSDGLDFDGPDEEAARRAALVLRALSNPSSGAIAAAATTSLPEGLGARGERNWDYRYSWIRDSTLAVRSLARIGFDREAGQFRRFIERSAAGHADDLQVLFGLGGERRLTEVELDHLDGFDGARPVRAGNAAAGQLQLDAYGHILASSRRALERGERVDEELWNFLRDLVDAACERWREPDAGFWEVRDRSHYTHSKAICWAAVDCGLTIAAERGFDHPAERWRQVREEIRAAVDEHGVDHDRGVFVRRFDGADLDAALLRLPISGYCAWDDERMLRTAPAIEEQLGDGGLLRRYDADDGFDVREGAFLACSFWLAECYARQGRREDAVRVHERALATANDVGLFSEEYDPAAGRMLGNFPQALTHLSLLESVLALAEADGAG